MVPTSLASLRILGLRAIALGTIAERAAQPEIRFVIRTTLSKRDDMFDFQAGHHEVPGTQTLPTAIARGHPHAAFHFNGDVSTSHVKRRVVSSRGPRPFSGLGTV